MSLCVEDMACFFVVGAMCSHVYCLSPPVLLPNNKEVLIPPPVSPSLRSIYFRLLVSVVLCWSVVFRHVCVMLTATVLCLPTCLFFSPSGWVFVYVVIKSSFSYLWVLASSLSSRILTERISQYEDSAEEGFVSSITRHYLQPPIQRILQFEALNDVRKFAVEFSGAAEGLGYNEAASRTSSTVPLMSPSAAGGWGGRTTWSLGILWSLWHIP